MQRGRVRHLVSGFQSLGGGDHLYGADSCTESGQHHADGNVCGGRDKDGNSCDYSDSVGYPNRGYAFQVDGECPG